MKIIATTSTGFIIEATTSEITGLMSSFGVEKPAPGIGQTIPAGDFSRDIEALTKFGTSYDFRQLREYANSLQKAIARVDDQLAVLKTIER